MTWGRVALTLSLAFLVLGLLSPVQAQVLYGSIVGTVVDPTGAVVPRASVNITNKATGLPRDIATHDASRYALLDVPLGKYDVMIGAAGFKPLIPSAADVRIDSVSRREVMLEK